MRTDVNGVGCVPGTRDPLEGKPDAYRRSQLFGVGRAGPGPDRWSHGPRRGRGADCDVSGVVLDTEGQPAEVESARVEELETTDSEPIVTAFDVAADGTFTVALQEWGTPDAPALARFVFVGPRGEPVVIDEEGCTEQTTPWGTLEVPIPGVVPTEPVEIVLDQVAD